jgi:PAS domain-containing protein
MLYSSSLSIAAASHTHRHAHPATLVIVIALVVFFVEILEPIVFGFLPPLPERTEVLVDALFMISVLTPFLYLFVMRPMAAQIQWREHADEQLRTVNQRLEALVEERTADLLGAGRQLSTLIDEQRSTAESLRRSDSFVAGVFNRTACLLLAFDPATRRCTYVNARITDLLGYEQDEIIASCEDLAAKLISENDRGRFLADVARVTQEASVGPTLGTFEFVTAADTPLRMVVGLSALDQTAAHHARNILLAAMPSSASDA